MSQKDPKAVRAARKTIKRMRRDPIKWRVAEHIHEALGRSGLISAQGSYTLASQIVDDITPMVLGTTAEAESKKD